MSNPTATIKNTFAPLNAEAPSKSTTPSLFLIRANANSEILKAFNEMVAFDFSRDSASKFLSVANYAKNIGLISFEDADQWAKEFKRAEKIAAYSGRLCGLITIENGGAA